MQAATQRTVTRRTTKTALKQQVLAFLGEGLPDEWSSQPLVPTARASADILILSPRGRCHFLFVHAPADRWWDGGPRSVPAERFSADEAQMARQLRAAGHRARAVWGAKDLERALKAWGCPLVRPVRLGGREEMASRRPDRKQRATLHLKAWEPVKNA